MQAPLFKKILLGTLTALITIPMIASAAQLKGGETYALNHGETIDDNVYAGGGTVSIDGTINGDLMVGGGTVSVSGSVRDDVTAGGGTVSIGGSVGNDIRVAGGTIIITATSTGDVIALGGQISILQPAKIKGDVIINGGTITVSAPIDGSLTMNGGSLTINSSITGNVTVTAGDLTLGDKALIQGSLTYASPKQAVFQNGSKVLGAISYTPQEIHKPRTGALGAAWLTKIAMLLAAAFVLWYLQKNTTTRYVQNTVTSFWKNVLRGFLTLVAAPLAVIICFATIIGIPLALIGLFFYLLLIALAAVYSGVLVGSMLYAKVMKQKNYNVDWQIILVGSVVLTIVHLIPVIGGLVSFVFFLAALGGLVDALRTMFMPAQEKKPLA